LISFQFKSFSSENDTTVNRIFTLIYNQQFTEAENTLNSQHNQLDPYYFNILKLDLYWWKYSLSKSKEDANVLNKVLDSFSESQIKSQEARINELIRSSYKMRYEIKRYNLFGALIIRSEVRKQIEVIKQNDLSFLGDRQKLFDLYLSLFSYFDNVINPFSFGGKSEEFSKSMQTLEDYSRDNDLVLSTMAHYFLGRIYMKVEKHKEKGQAHFRILSQRFPKNTLFHELANGLNPKF
jgi:hypothetical protein